MREPRVDAAESGCAQPDHHHAPRPRNRGANERKYMSRIPGWILISLVLVAPGAAQAQGPTASPPDYPRGRISGYMFGDFYYNVDGNPNHIYRANGNDLGKPNIDASNGAPFFTNDLNGFQLRR